ncbi:MAG: hypothetical protein IJB69_02710 [Clostridia bacterium]|nr:hypothetical protein [Clostridia bacterium]
MKKRLLFLAALLWLCCQGAAGAEEYPLQFTEPPLFGQVQVTELPGDALLLSYLSNNKNWRSEEPYYQVYGERFAILNRDGIVWEHAFRYLDEETADNGDYFCQFRLKEDEIFIELYFDSEMSNYGWYRRRPDGSAMEKSNKRVKLADEDICYTQNLYPFLLEEYRHMDEVGNPRVVIEHIPSGSVGQAVAANFKAVWGDRLYLVETLKDGQYALNVYGPDCELADRILLPFREIPWNSAKDEDSGLMYRNLCGMLVNGESAVFLAADTGSGTPYSLYVLNLETKETAQPLPLQVPEGEIELLAVQGEQVLFSLQSIPMHFTVNKGDASHWWHLYQVTPDGQVTFLEDLGRQLIWHGVQEETGQVTLLLRSLSDDTYTLRVLLP